MELYTESGNLFLRPAIAKDASMLARWKDDAYMRKMSIGEDAAVTPEIERADILHAKKKEFPYWIILLKANNHPVGYIRCDFMDEKRRMVWLRFGLGERRGEGHAKPALFEVLRHLTARGVERFEAEVYAFNTPCVHLLESLGFKREGVKRKAHHDKEGIHDIFVYGLLTADSP